MCRLQSCAITGQHDRSGESSSVEDYWPIPISFFKIDTREMALHGMCWDIVDLRHGR